MSQRRTINTPSGPITYELEKKRVKNLNLRLRDGKVSLSIPMQCSVEEADRLVRERICWIRKTFYRMADNQLPPLPAPETREACQSVLQLALEQAYPLVEPLGVKKPVLKIRTMTGQWGNCHWNQGYITLNTALARCPEELRVYVALHELVHFLHHGHGKDFYARMDTLMPDWRERRRELHRYSGALESERGGESNGISATGR